MAHANIAEWKCHLENFIVTTKNLIVISVNACMTITALIMRRNSETFGGYNEN